MMYELRQVLILVLVVKYMHGNVHASLNLLAVELLFPEFETSYMYLCLVQEVFTHALYQVIYC